MDKNKFVYKGKLYEVVVIDDKPTKISKPTIIRWLLVFCALFLLVWAFSFYNPPSNVNVNNINIPQAEIQPYPAYNGEIIIQPDYECICPLEVRTEKGMEDYYVRLHYLEAPYRGKRRRLSYSALPPHESDIAFYVSSGRSVKVDVPVGIYEFYYATGQTFYGAKELFGKNTSYYTSEEKLEFYVEDDKYNSIIITLQKVPYGNFSTHGVKKNSFPTD